MTRMGMTAMSAAWRVAWVMEAGSNGHRRIVKIVNPTQTLTPTLTPTLTQTLRRVSECSSSQNQGTERRVDVSSCLTKELLTTGDRDSEGEPTAVVAAAIAVAVTAVTVTAVTAVAVTAAAAY